MLENLIFGRASAPGLFVELLVCSALVILAGGRLAALGDKLSAITGLGHSWVGAIMLGGVTSLPELVVTIGAVTVVTAPALVFGNVLGSNCFNLLIIVVLDATLVGGAVLARGSGAHLLSAALGLMLMLIVAAGFILGQPGALLGGAPWLFSILLAVSFAAAMRVMYAREKKASEKAGKDSNREKMTPAQKRAVILKFCAFALVIVGAGLWLSVLGDTLGSHEFPGGLTLGKTFVGFLFIAIATSLPELSVSISAARQGFYDLALGNIFGSNIANMSFIFVAEIFLKPRGKDMFGSVENPAALLVTVCAACLMTVIAIIGMAGRPRRTIMNLGPGSIALALTYILSMFVVFKISSGS